MLRTDGSSVGNEGRRFSKVSITTTNVAVQSSKENSDIGSKSIIPCLNLSIVSRTIGSRQNETTCQLRFNPEDDYKFDSSDDEEEMRGYSENIKKSSATLYQELCKRYNKVPMKVVMRQFGSQMISLTGLNLSQKEIQAFFVALTNSEENDEMFLLKLDGNKLDTKHMYYLVEFACAHKKLVDLSLAGCELCLHDLKILVKFMVTNKTIRKLDISDNNLTDNAGESIAELIEYGQAIRELVLRGNKLADSGTNIGKALMVNVTLSHLDLSWNHIRANGAIEFCKGIKVNRGLEVLNLAWNGFGFEGSSAMGRALIKNTTLVALDLSNNNIHPLALFELIKGIQRNKALSSLQLSRNPITACMTSVLLSSIKRSRESNLKEVVLEGVVVDKDFNNILKEIEKERTFVVRYDKALPLNRGVINQFGQTNSMNIYPVRVLQFMTTHLRTICKFLEGDVDQLVSKSDMKDAFELADVPISDETLKQLRNYFEAIKHGNVDLLLLRKFLNNEFSLLEEMKEDAIFSSYSQTGPKSKWTEKDCGRLFRSRMMMI